MHFICPKIQVPSGMPLYLIIFSIRRSFLGIKNCHCSLIVTLTGVTVTDRACNFVAAQSSSMFMSSMTPLLWMHWILHGQMRALKLHSRMNTWASIILNLRPLRILTHLMPPASVTWTTLTQREGLTNIIWTNFELMKKLKSSYFQCLTAEMTRLYMSEEPYKLITYMGTHCLNATSVPCSIPQIKDITYSWVQDSLKKCPSFWDYNCELIVLWHAKQAAYSKCLRPCQTSQYRQGWCFSEPEQMSPYSQYFASFACVNLVASRLADWATDENVTLCPVQVATSQAKEAKYWE